LLTIVDYDAGNVKSVEKAFAALGAEPVVTRDPEKILAADRVVLPGVGNFGDALTNLRAFGLDAVLRQVIDAGTPFLGICVGMQALFAGSEESPDVPGLHFLAGACRRFTERRDTRSPRSAGTRSKNAGRAGSLPALTTALMSTSCTRITWRQKTAGSLRPRPVTRTSSTRRWRAGTSLPASSTRRSRAIRAF